VINTTARTSSTNLIAREILTDRKQ